MKAILENKKGLIEKHARKPGDTGSSEVQVAILTERIRMITDHLKLHPKDHAARRGLLMLVGARSRMLRHLRRSARERYQDLIRTLGLRK